MLCPTCHIMLGTHVKPKLYNALTSSGIELSEVWSKSIYEPALNVLPKPESGEGDMK